MLSKQTLILHLLSNELMKIHSYCQKCNAELQAKTSYDTRGEHAMRKGDFIEKRCRTCNTDNKIHIDDFRASESKEMKIFAVSAFIISLTVSILVFIWLLYQENIAFIWYGMFGIPFFIYGSLLVYDRNRVSTFNRLYSKR